MGMDNESDADNQADSADSYNKRNSYAGINPLIPRIAKNQARLLIGKYGFTGSDLPDLEQEFVRAGLKVMEQYASSGGAGYGLILAAIKHRRGKIVRCRYAGKRDWRKLQSLHEELPVCDEDDDGSMLIDYVATCGHLAPFDADERNPARRQMRCQDVNTAISRLPPHLQSICEDLKIMRPEEVISTPNLSHRVFYKHLAKIRRFFLYYLGEDEFGDPPRPNYRPIGWTQNRGAENVHR